MTSTNDLVCAICGADQDPDAAVEVDSTTLCATCAAMERATRGQQPLELLGDGAP